MRRSPAVVDRRSIALHVWDNEEDAFGSNTIDVHLARLRAKLAGAGCGSRLCAASDTGSPDMRARPRRPGRRRRDGGRAASRSRASPAESVSCPRPDVAVHDQLVARLTQGAGTTSGSASGCPTPDRASRRRGLDDVDARRRSSCGGSPRAVWRQPGSPPLPALSPTTDLDVGTALTSGWRGSSGCR